MCNKNLDGKLWSFLRKVLAHGEDIHIDYKNNGYEEKSAKFDSVASDYVIKLIDILKKNERI